MKALVLLFGIVIGHSVLAQDADTYTTAVRHQTFRKVQGPGNFGLAWQAPDGTLWSADQGQFPNTLLPIDGNVDDPVHRIVGKTAATEACAKISGQLPTEAQVNHLAGYFAQYPLPVPSPGFPPFVFMNFLTQTGIKDLKAMIPALANGCIWSVDYAGAKNSEGGRAFDANFGSFGPNSIYYKRSYNFDVICVR